MAMFIPMLAAVGGASSATIAAGTAAGASAAAAGAVTSAAITGGALVTSVAATGLSAVASMRQGQYQDLASKRQAEQEKMAGEVRALQSAKRLNARLASLNVASAVSGIRAGSGSPQNIIRKSIEEGELESLLGRAGTKARIGSIRAEGRYARRSGVAKGAVSLLQAGSTAMEGYGNYQSSQNG